MRSKSIEDQAKRGLRLATPRNKSQVRAAPRRSPARSSCPPNSLTRVSNRDGKSSEKLRNNEVPRCYRGQHSCKDAWPKTTNERRDDDRRVERREYLDANVLPNEAAHQDGNRN